MYHGSGGASKASYTPAASAPCPRVRPAASPRRVALSLGALDGIDTLLEVAQLLPVLVEALVKRVGPALCGGGRGLGRRDPLGDRLLLVAQRGNVMLRGHPL